MHGRQRDAMIWRGTLIALLTVAVSSPSAALHLEGDAEYKAAGRCFEPKGAVPLGEGLPAAFRLRPRRVRGVVRGVLDYDLSTGACALELFEQNTPRTEPVFQGRCWEYPPGNPFPLQPVQDPKRRLELLPVIAADTIGFGGINGYLVFPPGGLSGASLLDPIGFSGHFTYTTTFVPPSAAVYRSPWLLGIGPTFQRCIFRGTVRLGAVPIF